MNKKPLRRTKIPNIWYILIWNTKCDDIIEAPYDKYFQEKGRHLLSKNANYQVGLLPE